MSEELEITAADVECKDRREILPGISVRCERERDHKGDHGSTPYIEFTTTWPQPEPTP